jgi:cytochrome c-type biogenesis protein CcmH/NrfF
MRALIPLLAIGWLLLSCKGDGGASGHSPTERSAREIERRLIAPCCWRETLDVHASPLATQLRAEIRSRIAKGEVGERIENELVTRYGSRMIAHIPESQGAWLVALVGCAGALLLYVLAHRPAPAPAQDSSGERSRRTETAGMAAPLEDQDYRWQLDKDLLEI